MKSQTIPLPRRARLTLVAWVALVATPARAQTTPVAPVAPVAAVAATPIYKLRADFTVPEGPAFKLVDIDQSAILRPTSVREFTASLGEFTGDGGRLRLPSAVGVEVSPALLLRGRDLTLKEYGDRRLLYRLRLSAAAKAADSTRRPTRLGGGVRITLRDDADVRLDTVLQTRILANLRLQNDVYKNVPPNLDDPSHEIVLGPEDQAKIDALDAQLGKIVDDRRQERWNATAVEAAAAVSGRAVDSLTGDGMRFDQASLWATVGLRAGANGQFLIGLRGLVLRDTARTNRGKLLVSSRYYVGTADYKVFVEAQVGSEKDQDFVPYLFNSGGEVRISESLWGQFSAGLEQTAQQKRGRFVSRFTLRTALPRT